MTYKIRTHNPIISLFTLVVVIFIASRFIHDKFGNGIELFLFIIVYFASEMINYYLFNNKVIITVTESGINTNWMQSPFYLKTKKEIMWSEIDSWYFDRSRSFDIFSIKTKDKRLYSIRCLNIYKTQTQLYKFVNQVTYEIDSFNRQQRNSIYKIENTQISINRTKHTVFIITISIVAILTITFLISSNIKL